MQPCGILQSRLGEGVAVAFDASANLVGIEVLDACARFGGREGLTEVMLEGVGGRV